jgi:hypothetical protein
MSNSKPVVDQEANPVAQLSRNEKDDNKRRRTNGVRFDTDGRAPLSFAWAIYVAREVREISFRCCTCHQKDPLRNHATSVFHEATSIDLHCKRSFETNIRVIDIAVERFTVLQPRIEIA